MDNAVLNAGLDPNNPQIVALVAHFQAGGIRLVYDTSGWWRVTPPVSPQFEVIVSLRAFPESASADQLRVALTRINLAYLLNSTAHVAMSYSGVRGAGRGALVDSQFIAFKSKLERLFQEYRPQ